MSEKGKLASSLTRMKDILSNEDIDKSFEKELANPDNISDRYLEEKIIEFCKTMLKTAQIVAAEGKGLQGVVDLLFSVFLLLKKIQNQSYEQYWSSVYNKNYARLSNQRGIYEQKELGYRFLRSKIRAILKIE